jgi:hypothetical protein
VSETVPSSDFQTNKIPAVSERAEMSSIQRKCRCVARREHGYQTQHATEHEEPSDIDVDGDGRDDRLRHGETSRK